MRKTIDHIFNNKLPLLIIALLASFSITGCHSDNDDYIWDSRPQDVDYTEENWWSNSQSSDYMDINHVQGENQGQNENQGQGENQGQNENQNQGENQDQNENQNQNENQVQGENQGQNENLNQGENQGQNENQNINQSEEQNSGANSNENQNVNGNVDYFGDATVGIRNDFVILKIKSNDQLNISSKDDLLSYVHIYNQTSRKEYEIQQIKTTGNTNEYLLQLKENLVSGASYVFEFDGGIITKTGKQTSEQLIPFEF